MKFIKLPYSPLITKEVIMDILREEYPEKKVTKLFNQVRIKQNALRVAQIIVTHNEKKKLTQIAVAAAMPVWVPATILIPIIFVILGSYSFLGNWATEITEKLKLQLQKPQHMEKSHKTRLHETIAHEPVATEKQTQAAKRTTSPSKVSFAKFGHINTDF